MPYWNVSFVCLLFFFFCFSVMTSLQHYQIKQSKFQICCLPSIKLTSISPLYSSSETTQTSTENCCMLSLHRYRFKETVESRGTPITIPRVSLIRSRYNRTVECLHSDARKKSEHLVNWQQCLTLPSTLPSQKHNSLVILACYKLLTLCKLHIEY